MSSIARWWVLNIFIYTGLILSEVKEIEFLNNIVLFIIVASSFLTMFFFNDNVLKKVIEKTIDEKREMTSKTMSFASGLFLLLLLVGFSHYIVAIIYSIQILATFIFKSAFEEAKKN